MAPPDGPSFDDVVPPQKLTYTMSEAAALIGIHVQTARHLAFIGEFPVEVIRVGHRWFVRRGELDAFLSGKPS